LVGLRLWGVSDDTRSRYIAAIGNVKIRVNFGAQPLFYWRRFKTWPNHVGLLRPAMLIVV